MTAHKHMRDIARDESATNTDTTPDFLDSSRNRYLKFDASKVQLHVHTHVLRVPVLSPFLTHSPRYTLSSVSS